MKIELEHLVTANNIFKFDKALSMLLWRHCLSPAVHPNSITNNFFENPVKNNI